MAILIAAVPTAALRAQEGRIFGDGWQRDSIVNNMTDKGSYWLGVRAVGPPTDKAWLLIICGNDSTPRLGIHLRPQPMVSIEVPKSIRAVRLEQGEYEMSVRVRYDHEPPIHERWMYPDTGRVILSSLLPDPERVSRLSRASRFIFEYPAANGPDVLTFSMIGLDRELAWLYARCGGRPAR